MEKKIVLYASYDGSVYTVCVSTQTHLCGEFGNPYRDFISSTGLALISCSNPAAFEDDDTVYVRGDNFDGDELEFRIYSTEFMQRIMHAVREYNSHTWVAKLPDAPTTRGAFLID